MALSSVGTRRKRYDAAHHLPGSASCTVKPDRGTEWPGVTTSWIDNSKNETSFVLERATDLAFTQNVKTYSVPTVGQVQPFNMGVTSGELITYVDPNPLDAVPTYYRVQALNERATIYSATVPQFTTQASPWSGVTAILPTLTITASSANVNYGDPVPSITPSFSGFIGGDNQYNSLTTQPTCTTTYIQGSAVTGSPYSSRVVRER